MEKCTLRKHLPIFSVFSNLTGKKTQRELYNKMLPSAGVIIVALILALGPVATTHAGTLYGAEQTADGDLLDINTVTGSGAPIGNLGFTDVRGLACDPNSQILYGLNSHSTQLITINTTTGAGTLVGDIGFGVGDVEGLAFDPNTNTLYGGHETPGVLITINTSTGTGASVGPVGYDFLEALAFNPDTNTLYGVVTDSGQILITINTSTGAGTPVGAIGFDDVEGLGFDPDTDTLYGVTDEEQLITINTSTGAGTLVGVIGDTQTEGLTVCYSTSSSSIPTINQWGMVVFILLMGAGAVFFIRRRSIQS